MKRSFQIDFSTFILWGMMGVISLVSLVCLIDSFSQGIGYCDEAWNLLLIQNSQPALGTNFALYYHFMSNWHVTHIRIFAALLWFISWGTLAYSSLRYFRHDFLFKNWQKWLIIFFTCTISQLPWLEGAAPFPEYRQLAAFFAFTGFAILLFSLDDTTSRRWQTVSLLVSGMFYAQLFFTVAPIVIVIPILLLLLWRKSPRHSILFCLGGIMGVILYFSLIQSPLGYYKEFLYSLNASTHAASGRHGTSMLVTCYMKLILTYLTIIIPGGFSLFGIDKLDAKQPSSNKIRIVIYGAFLAGFILEAIRLVRWNNGGVPAFSVIYILVLLVQLAFMHWEKGKRKFDIWILLLAIVLPSVFCTATDQGFGNRLTSFIPCVYLYVVILANVFESRGTIRLLAFCLVFGFVFGCIYLKRSNAFRHKTMQTTLFPLPSKALVNESKGRLVQKILQESNDCPYWATDEFSWDLVFLAQKKPLLLKRFRYYQFDDLAALCKEKELNARDIVFVETPERALNAAQLLAVKQALMAEGFEKIKLGDNKTLIRFF